MAFHLQVDQTHIMLNESLLAFLKASLVETTECTDSQSKTILAYLTFSCADKNKKLAKLEEKIRSVRSV